MSRFTILLRLGRDTKAAMLVEFALLAPLLFTMMIGVFHVGQRMQNFNAVKSLASDAGRYVMVEYQKGNEVTNADIKSVVRGKALGAPYLLNTDQLVVNAETAAISRIAGAKEIDLTIEYTLEDWLPFVDLPFSKMVYSRPIFVVVAPAPPTPPAP
ncbi:pilus assembly protein [Altererythrobacter confluentis]|uniref:Pilus assembly protein n=1 Tax=Allopontixanthobacter confluentis TaxID=1849021 RepID=A0A6L7GDY8_9SPHN|nr:TadE family protein [Allopontixanthobacter confluentis]MXP14137.1 pilus assembly protein [Allopontixanthobacter confluentis]